MPMISLKMCRLLRADVDIGLESSNIAHMNNVNSGISIRRLFSINIT